MKTLGQLRKLIADNGGKIEIGKLTIDRPDNADVDVYFDGELYQWFNKEQANEALLTDDNSFTVASHVQDRNEQLFQAGKKIRELKPQNETLVQRSDRRNYCSRQSRSLREAPYRPHRNPRPITMTRHHWTSVSGSASPPSTCKRISANAASATTLHR
jgi:hypothetical protein